MNSVYSLIVIGLIGLLNIIVLFKVLIPFFKRLKFGQSIREEGPRSHEIKKGTPTMGGIIIIIGTIFLSLTLFLFNYKNENFFEMLLIYIPFITFGIIGFIDDYLIITKKNNEGLKPKIKFLLQLVVSIISYYLIIHIRNNNYINFFGNNLDIGFLYGIFIVLCFTGFSNATNLTDGLDGLLGGSSLIVFFVIFLLAMKKENDVVMIFSFSYIISIIAFLIFNLPKASIFMGDTGSLAIGAALFSLLMMLDMDILIFIFGIIYLIETLTVMLQVWFFKRSKGDRLFRMTPYHHHLEILGFSDIEIDIMFWFVAMVTSILGYILGVYVF